MSGFSSFPATLISYVINQVGGVYRTVQSKLSDTVSDADFGAVGDGVTDDLVALTNFWNSAIANPGVTHTLRSLTYAISAELPVVNVSGVIIKGPGARRIDVAPYVEGCVIQYTGAYPGGFERLVDFEDCDNITFTGIGIDAQNNYGECLRNTSVSDSVFDVVLVRGRQVNFTITNNGTTDIDCENNQYRVFSHCGSNALNNGYSMYIGLTASTGVIANNTFYLDAICDSSPAINASRCNNNVWEFFKARLIAGGSQITLAEFNGNATASLAFYNNIFEYYSVHLISNFGSGFANIRNNQILFLDTASGTPAPTFTVAGAVSWADDTNSLPDTPWITSFVPVVTASIGAITTYTATCEYIIRGNLLSFTMRFTNTTNGTGAGMLTITTPVVSASAIGNALSAVGGASGVTCRALLAPGTNQINVLNSAGLYPTNSGENMFITGSYQIA